jgi:hypothetical protein
MGLQRRCFVSPSRLGIFAETKECAEVEQRREVFLGAETGRDSHSTFRRPPPGFQWPRDMATMALLERARTGKNSIECVGKDVIRDPYVLRRGRPERLHCSAACNGWAVHQAWLVIGGPGEAWFDIELASGLGSG